MSTHPRTEMGESRTAILSNSAFCLRLYGVGCVLAGVAFIAVNLGIRPGAHGVANWNFVGFTGAVLALLGIAVILLRWWAVVLFSLLSFIFSVWFLWITMLNVPFPFELVNVVLGVLALLPVFLIRRAWDELR